MKATKWERSSGPAESCGRDTEHRLFGSSFWKGELEGIFEGLTPCTKESEVYYLGDKEVIEDF